MLNLICVVTCVFLFSATTAFHVESCNFLSLDCDLAVSERDLLAVFFLHRLCAMLCQTVVEKARWKVWATCKPVITCCKQF